MQRGDAKIDTFFIQKIFLVHFFGQKIFSVQIFDQKIGYIPMYYGWEVVRKYCALKIMTQKYIYL